jgi:hypothetical protein
MQQSAAPSTGTLSGGAQRKCGRAQKKSGSKIRGEIAQLEQRREQADEAIRHDLGADLRQLLKSIARFDARITELNGQISPRWITAAPQPRRCRRQCIKRAGGDWVKRAGDDRDPATMRRRGFAAAYVWGEIWPSIDVARAARG